MIETVATASSKAVESLQAAKFLRDKKLWNNSVSRSYYAAAQATTALLLKHNQFPPKPNHAKVQAALRNLLKQKHAKHAFLADELRNLEAFRYDADYEEKNMTPKYAQQCFQSASDLKNTFFQLLSKS
jgi:uncharacterized protein (UPF0332 family)